MVKGKRQRLHNTCTLTGCDGSSPDKKQISIPGIMPNSELVLKRDRKASRT